MKQKIIIAILVLYTIILIVLGVIVARRPESESVINPAHEKRLEEYYQKIDRRLGRIESRDPKKDSLQGVINRLTESYALLEGQKANVTTRLNRTLASLGDKSLDSLKIIALDK